MRDRVAVVTGGASGIGRAVAELLLAEHCHVVVADLDETATEELVEAVDQLGQGDRLRTLRVDVTDEADMAAAAELAESAFGQLDAWFNNAAVPGAVTPLLETSVESWDATVAVVLRSVFLGIKHAGARMAASGRGGSIVNTASVAAVIGSTGPVPYAAAKAGVVNLTRYAAVELAPYRIRVNAVCPGSILTPMAEKAGSGPERMRSRQPWPDYGRPEYVAAVMAFLASDAAQFVTGEAVTVDGGLVAAGAKILIPGSWTPTAT